MIRQLSIPLTLIAMSASAGDINSYSDKQALQIRALNQLQQRYSPKNHEADQNYFGAIERALNERRRISDNMVVERLDRNPDMLHRISTEGYLDLFIEDDKRPKSKQREPKPWEQTIDGDSGAVSARKYNSEIPEEEIRKRVLQSSECKGELDDGTQKYLIAKCFTSLNDPALLITPYATLDKTYTRGLSSTSSLVDQLGRHVCVVSVIRKGVWVSAKHCLEDSVKFESLRIISGAKKVQISSVAAAPCKEPCDIAFFFAETPEDAEIPVIKPKGAELKWDNPIFIPGVPYGFSLSSVLKPEPATTNTPVSDTLAKNRYNNLVMWPPYNEGFCMTLTKDTSGCIVHTCSTVRGFSGAPIYRYNSNTDKIELIGIHSGADKQYNNCAIDDKKVNYARLITTEDLPK